jgi:hypothetical protein
MAESKGKVRGVLSLRGRFVAINQHRKESTTKYYLLRVFTIQFKARILNSKGTVQPFE